ncbi:arabinose ABC transporter permease AraQ [Pseudolactococcus yaeyamensis]
MTKKIVLIVIFCLLLYPIFSMLVVTLQARDEFQRLLIEKQFIFLPIYTTFNHYLKLVLDVPENYAIVFSTIKLLFGILLIQLPCNTMVAYFFAQNHNRFGKIVYKIYIALLILPFSITMITQYGILKELHLLDSYLGVILLMGFSPFTILILVPSFARISEEVLEAGRMDGASEWQIFYKIALPNVKLAVICSIFFAVLEMMSMIEIPLIFLRTEKKMMLAQYVEILMRKEEQSAISFIILIVIVLILFLKNIIKESEIVANESETRV